MLSHTRPMTDALITDRPVVRSTRSNARLKVRFLGAVCSPSSAMVGQPVPSVHRDTDGQNPATPTTGCCRDLPPIDPWKVAEP